MLSDKQQKIIYDIICEDVHGKEFYTNEMFEKLLSKVEEITYHAYGRDKVNRIDYVFRSNGVSPKSYRLVKDEYEGLPPSDHYPVECVFEIDF